MRNLILSTAIGATLLPLAALASPPGATGSQCFAEAQAIAARWAPSWAGPQTIERQTRNVALLLGCYSPAALAAAGWGEGDIRLVPAASPAAR